MRPAPAAELIAWGYWVLPSRAQAPLDPRGRAVVPTALDAVETVDAAERAVVADGLGVDARLELGSLRVAGDDAALTGPVITYVLVS